MIGPALTEADAAADLAGTPRPDFGLQPHEQRVIAEYAELVDRVKKLTNFRLGARAERLPEVERDLLRQQEDAMARYAAVLSKRIARFGKATGPCTCGPHGRCSCCDTGADPLLEWANRPLNFTGQTGTMAGVTLTEAGTDAAFGVGMTATDGHKAEEAGKNAAAMRAIEVLTNGCTPEPRVITPTVGRKVWFKPGKFRDLPHGLVLLPVNYEDDQPLDATVVYVHDDHTVNLLVVDHVGNQFPFESVHLVQPSDQCCPAGHRAEWMPYQVKQAGAA